MDEEANLLNDTTSIHLHRKFHDMVLHLLRQYTLLNLITMLEKLLDDIVAEYVSHQLKCIWLNFAEELLLLIAVGSF
jgi:hypothetical protein